MINYVVGFMRSMDGKIVLLRKLKPASQIGKLNGVGGKIEDGETTLEAMTREFQEETTIITTGWIHFAKMVYPGNCVVHCFALVVDTLPSFPEKNDIGEKIEIHNYEEVVRSSEMIPNLLWLLPLAFDDPDQFFVDGLAYYGTVHLGREISANND